LSANTWKPSQKAPARKDKEPVLTLTEQWKEWGDAHINQIGGAFAALLVILAIAWGWNAYGNAREARARTDYSIVLKGLPSEDATDSNAWEKVLPELEKFVQEHQGTRVALSAQLDLSRVLFKTKKYEESLKEAEKVFSSVGQGDALRPLARYQAAMSAQASGNVDIALAQWQALRQEGFPGIDREIDWNLAKLYLKKGEPSKAAELYEKAINTQGDYPGTGILQEELASVKSKTQGS
jgi:predicted negative regulator of RcsB-dependent stress response